MPLPTTAIFNFDKIQTPEPNSTCLRAIAPFWINNLAATCHEIELTQMQHHARFIHRFGSAGPPSSGARTKTTEGRGWAQTEGTGFAAGCPAQASHIAPTKTSISQWSET
jgi:hypothetical protein